MVYMRKKPAFILMIVLGTICVIDGAFSKHDIKEFLVGAAVLIYAVVGLVNLQKEKKAGMGPNASIPGPKKI